MQLLLLPGEEALIEYSYLKIILTTALVKSITAVIRAIAHPCSRNACVVSWTFPLSCRTSVTLLHEKYSKNVSLIMWQLTLILVYSLINVLVVLHVYIFCGVFHMLIIHNMFSE